MSQTNQKENCDTEIYSQNQSDLVKTPVNNQILETSETEPQHLTELLPTIVEIAVATGVGIDIVTKGIQIIDEKKEKIKKAAKTIHSWRGDQKKP